MIKVLFTGGGGAGNEALYRLLGDKYSLHFGDADISTIDPIIPAGRRHTLPWASDSDFVERMAEICRQLDIDVLVPGVDEELLTLAQNEAIFWPTKILLPSEAYIETMLDKLRMVHVLLEKNIPVPLSHSLAEDFSDIEFPCISKPRSGRGSREVSILNTAEDARGHKIKFGASAGRMLIQEKVEGIEYTVQMVSDSLGTLRAIVPVKVDIKRGITIRAETEAEPLVIAACKAVHEAVPARGCYNIQLIKTPEGDVLPFEINPRVSTTLCLVVAAGIDPIAVFFMTAQSDGLIPFTPGIRLRRHWTNYFL
ncbi:ATP-grasp domain-containing protein [Castellaniella sp.]|uniref:ATP-grasp domain-containing protein n=1 Tax=Castellaniella sp. TaxID=1955812 RepID=UPI003A8FCAD8